MSGSVVYGISANKLNNHWFLYSNGVNGAGLKAAEIVVKNGPDMYNMFYNARVGVITYTKQINDKGDVTAYGNLSYNEIHDSENGMIR